MTQFKCESCGSNLSPVGHVVQCEYCGTWQTIGIDFSRGIEGSSQHDFLIKLRDAMRQACTLADLEEVCFVMNQRDPYRRSDFFMWENMAGQTKSAKVLSIIQYADRYCVVKELLDTLFDECPAFVLVMADGVQ